MRGRVAVPLSCAESPMWTAPPHPALVGMGARRQRCLGGGRTLLPSGLGHFPRHWVLVIGSRARGHASGKLRRRPLASQAWTDDARVIARARPPVECYIAHDRPSLTVFNDGQARDGDGGAGRLHPPSTTLPRPPSAPRPSLGPPRSACSCLTVVEGAGSRIAAARLGRSCLCLFFSAC